MSDATRTEDKSMSVDATNEKGAMRSVRSGRMVRGRAPKRVGYYRALLKCGRVTIMNYHPWTSKEDLQTGKYLDYGDVVAWSRIPGQRYAAP